MTGTRKPRRAWQRMLSGRRLDLLDPSALDIEIEDIAHGLARVARWNGQTDGDWPFSVAQHSVLVEDIVTRITPLVSNPSKVRHSRIRSAWRCNVGSGLSCIGPAVAA